MGEHVRRPDQPEACHLRLAGLQRIDSPLLLGFRTAGLMVGIDLPDAEVVLKVRGKMLSHGAHSSLSTGATMRWMPPLVITEEQVDNVLEAFESALREVEYGDG